VDEKDLKSPRSPDEPEEVDLGLQRKLILVVDDDPDLREYVREVLELAHYRVKMAASGAMALHELADEAPDLVLLDMRMPGISGGEVLDLLAGIHGHPPVVIMTAADTARDSALEHHNPYYLAKPFEPTMLLATIETALEEPSEPEPEFDA
jgi:DNA-binding response OmpR family regulator